MTSRDTARGRRQTFWMDDRVIDAFAPVMRRYACGAAALAIYAALARRAGHDGESWPRLGALAEQAATSERTAQRAIQLLEVLGLIEVTSCFEAGSNRQTSNLYTLLTPPAAPPELDTDPARWPTPARRTLVVQPGHRAQPVADARQAPPVRPETPRQPGAPPPASLTPRPRHADTPSPAILAPQEGRHSVKDTTVKDRFVTKTDAPTSFTIAEVGLSSGQVWAAALAELARGGTVSPTDLEAWLRPAALVGRQGETLLLGAPNRAARDRITARHLPAVRAALARVVGMPLPVTVVAGGQAGACAAPRERASGPLEIA